MGIPKFFRWMSERYPGLLTTAKENQLPEIDNFYLDMNGIIHNCTHPCDGDVHFRISEDEMFEDIFNYINTLFKIIKPRQIFFMAIDGVAPRAKMNQQRGRRFRSAKEASDREEAALKKGDILPDESRFDSNCITPGTKFMNHLHKALQDFIKMKLATDPTWQHVKVILSGHETPGEGEHKVMDFIRFQRSQPNYNPQTRHCLYGLDTDLIMLGLSSHEPNFMLLREEIKFSNNKRNDQASKSNQRAPANSKSQRVDPSKISFNVLYLTLLRDYIERDFLPLKSKMPFNFDLEAIIDDWILICFLIGNDFIPHIPHFHIHKNALPTIFEIYQSTLTKLDGYLNEKGVLNLKRFKIFAKALSLADFENYKKLVKENGGECARDDFAKLNMFVKHKIRITGIKNDNSAPNRKSYTRKSDHNGHPTNHTNNHSTDVWYNIQQKNQPRSNGRQRASMHTKVSISNNNGSKNQYVADLNSILGKLRLKGQKMKGQNSTNGNSNNGGGGGGRIGVHSFTEEQINNSITVCADGDFIDLSDDEYLSDEKFPGEPPKNGKMLVKEFSIGKKGTLAVTNGGLAKGNLRSTPKKDIKNGKLVTKILDRKVSTMSDMDYFESYKRTYYREKLKLNPPKRPAVMKVVQEYVRALQWNLHYYYHGCMSWGWFYPYHYAPFISDVANFENIDVDFEMGTPFKPFEQLLSVLPAASSELLPKVFRSLVTTKDSPLAKYFPTEVEYDLNGKQNDWEAVVLAPFIEEEALLNASHVYNLFLTPEERAANIHGPHLCFYYDGPRQSGSNSKNVRRQPLANGGISLDYVKREQVGVDGFHMPREKIKYGLLDGSRCNNFVPDQMIPNAMANGNNQGNNSDHKGGNQTNNHHNTGHTNNNGQNSYNGNNTGQNAYNGNNNSRKANQNRNYNNNNSYNNGNNGNGYNNRANNNYYQNNRRSAEIK